MGGVLMSERRASVSTTTARGRGGAGGEGGTRELSRPHRRHRWRRARWHSRVPKALCHLHDVVVVDARGGPRGARLPDGVRHSASRVCIFDDDASRWRRHGGVKCHGAGAAQGGGGRRPYERLRRLYEIVEGPLVVKLLEGRERKRKYAARCVHARATVTWPISRAEIRSGQGAGDGGCCGEWACSPRVAECLWRFSEERGEIEALLTCGMRGGEWWGRWWACAGRVAGGHATHLWVE